MQLGIFNSSIAKKALIGICSMFVIDSAAVASKECDAWFKKNNIFVGKTCVNACSSLPLDFSTISCESECAASCKKFIEENSGVMNSVFKLYPGLTDAERALASKRPVEALRAYQLSWEAESECKKIYKVSDTNDESDACRHYIWAGMMVNQFGTKLAQEFLNAHEVDLEQPEREREMDQANNKSGIDAALPLLKRKKFSTENLVEQFKKDLQLK